MTFIEAVNLIKRITGQTMDLAIMTKKKELEKQALQAKSNKKCFYYGKKFDYTKDCYSAQKRKPEEEKSSEEAKQT